MPFRQMKYFIIVVDCSSFTEAVNKCYISPSPISQQIRSPENNLGVELIPSQKELLSQVQIFISMAEQRLHISMVF